MLNVGRGNILLVMLSCQMGYISLVPGIMMVGMVVIQYIGIQG